MKNRYVLKLKESSCSRKGKFDMYICDDSIIITIIIFNTINMQCELISVYLGGL